MYLLPADHSVGASAVAPFGRIRQHEQVQPGKHEQGEREQRRVGHPGRGRTTPSCQGDDVSDHGRREGDRDPTVALSDPLVQVHGNLHSEVRSQRSELGLGVPYLRLQISGLYQEELVQLLDHRAEHLSDLRSGCGQCGVVITRDIAAIQGELECRFDLCYIFASSSTSFSPIIFQP